MPPGYTAFFLWVASAVLWWSGWREETADGIPDSAVAAFLAGWPLTAWMNLPVGGTVSVNGAFVWTALATIALSWRMENVARWTALSSGFLTGSFVLLLTSSVWLPVHIPDAASRRAIAAMAGAAACLLVHGAAGQVSAITLAVSLPELTKTVWIHENSVVGFGSGDWMEGWWIAVLSARSLSALATAVRWKILGIGWKRGREDS